MSGQAFLLFITALAVSTLLGYFIVTLLWPPEISRRPAFALAPGIGAGLCSLIFFVFRRPMFTVEIALLVILATLWLLKGRGRFVDPRKTVLQWRPSVIGLFLTGVLALVLSGLMLRVNIVPHGDWDGFAIWNSHARYLYRDGASWQRDIQNSFHPDYPLLVPSLTARLWRYAGEEAPEAAGILGMVFTLSGIALLATTLAELRDPWLAILATLPLASTPFYLEYGVSHSADVPISFYFLSTVALICLSERALNQPRLLALAGFTAGCAGWTKNEGVLFILIVTAVLLLPVLFRKPKAVSRFGWFVAGLALPLAVIAAFKLTIAPPNDITSNRHYVEVIEKLLNLDRYSTILDAFAKTMWSFGDWSVQPVIPFLLFVGLRVANREAIRSFGWRASVAVFALMLTGYYAVYVVTPIDLHTHIESSLPRLCLQLWPMFLLVCGLLAAPAESP